jgi:hypothetical protein
MQQFLPYTDAKDIKGNSLTVLSQDELLEKKLKEMGLSKP